MRYPKEKREQTRRRIIGTASRRFRAAGIDAVGVANLMQSMGLTHGALYKHFASKDALVASASVAAFDETLPQLRAHAMAAPAGKRLKALFAAYVNKMHRDKPQAGCLGAALMSEIGRQPAPVRQAVDGKLNEFLLMIQDIADADQCSLSPHAVLALVVGAVALSRIPV